MKLKSKLRDAILEYVYACENVAECGYSVPRPEYIENRARASDELVDLLEQIPDIEVQ